MIDIHSHIIPGIDDGSKGIEETIQILKEAKQVGYDKIVMTPHYLEGRYETDAKMVEKLLEAVKQVVDREKIDISLYIGNEIYVSNNMDEWIQENTVSTLNKSRYVLFELPMENKILNIENIILKLLSLNVIPIIAHPERYDYVQKDPNMLIELIQMGVLFQSNLGSIIGIYGNKARLTVIKLLKNNMVHFLASDVHKKNSIYTYIDTIQKELREYITEEKIVELTEENPKKVIENEEIEISKPTKIKKSFFLW